MKRGLGLLLLVCGVLALPARAAPALEALRAEAKAAQVQAQGLRERQQALRTELEGLAGRIEVLKAERKGRLVAGGELEAALRRSQELSGELTGLAQALAGAEAEQARRHLALEQALSAELSRVRAAWEGTREREERARLVERLRALRAERESVRGALPASQVPAVGRAGAEDDPEDLLEQADALRDSEDKVRERLAALRERLAQVREERELERRMSDFLGEESLFDEQDRRLRLRVDPVSRSVSVDRTQPVGLPGSSADSAFDPPSPPSDVSTPGPPSGPTEPDLPIRGPGVPAVLATDVRPQVGAPGAAASGAPEDLRSLEAEAARLESLARELDSRARALEQRARTLE